jgi:hypothetical protein
MPNPWRIAEQGLTLVDPKSGEPGPTLSFIHWPERADLQTLRIVMPDIQSDAIEVDFATGGQMVQGSQRAVPRWLRPGEQLDPNLHLDDDGAAHEHYVELGGPDATADREEGAPLPPSSDAAEKWKQRRETMLARRASYYETHDGTAAPDPVDEDFVESDGPPDENPPVDTRPKARQRQPA